MREELDELPEEDVEDVVESRPPSKVVVGLIVAVGLGLGGFAGMTALGEPIGVALAERAQHADDGGGGHGGGHGEPADAEETSIHTLDNIVVNPARSGGSRFLLTAVAIDVLDPDYVEIVAAREVHIRAALILLLGSKTTEQLNSIENRRLLVAEIRREVIGVLGDDIVRDVYLPQFVIQ